MAGNLGSDKIQLEVIIDGSPARKELAELSKATANLRAEQDKLIAQQKALKDRKLITTDPAEIKRLTVEEAKLREERRKGIDSIAANNQKLGELRKEIGLTALSYRELQQRQMALRQALRAGAASLGIEEFNRLEDELVEVEKRMNTLSNSTERQIRVWDRMRTGMKLSQMTGEQLELEIKRLQLAMNRTPSGDVMGLRRLRNELTAAENQLATMRSGLGPFGRLWAEVKTQVYSAGAVLGGMLAAGGIVSGFQGLVRSSKEYSDQLSDVRKTTGLTGEAVKALANEISRIDTRTSRQELLALARDAGKLGLSGREDIMAFVKAGNQINVALGEDLGEDAIKNIAKLVDLFKLKDQFGLEDSMLKVGSAINELGMSSTASEGYIVEFLRRMGGIAPLAGITIDQTLALGATLDSLGQTSEVSSTALSKLFVKLGTDAEKYAGLAGMSVEKFRGILQNNALEAFIAVLEGTKKTEGGVVALSETLGEMGIDAARAAGVFGVLSQNTERLREQMGIANAAFRDGSSVTGEYALRNENLAAQIEKLGKEFNRLFANNTMVEWLGGLVRLARESIDWLTRNKDAVGTFLRLLLSAVGVWASYRGAVALSNLQLNLGRTATLAFAAAKALLTGNITKATHAMRLLSTAIKLNPYGLMASVLTTIAGAMWSLRDSMDAVSIGVSDEVVKLRVLHAQILTTNQGTVERKRLLDELRALYPEYLQHLIHDKVSNVELADAVKLLNDQLINKAVLQQADQELQAAIDSAGGARKQQIESEIRLQELLIAAYDKTGYKQKEGLSVMEQYLDFRGKFAGDDLPIRLLNLLDSESERLKAAQRALNETTDQGNAIAQRRVEIMRKLGLAAGGAADATEQQTMTVEQINSRIQELQDTLANPRLKKGDSLVDVTAMEIELDRLLAMKKQVQAEEEKQVRSVQFLNDAIKGLQEQQEQASDPARYKELQGQIDALEKERDRITGARKKERVSKEEMHLDDLLKQYQQFQGQLRADTLTADQKELEDLDLKHASELQKVRNQQSALIKAKQLTPEQAATDINALSGQQAAERDALEKVQLQRRLDAIREANQKIEGLLKEHRNQELQAELTAVEASIGLAEQKGQTTVELERRRLELLLQISERNSLDLVDQERARWDEYIDTARKALADYDAALAAQPLDPTEDQLAQRQQLADGLLALETAQAEGIKRIRKKHRADDLASEREYNTAVRMERIRQLQGFAQVADSLGNLFQSIAQMRQQDVDLAERQADEDGVRTNEEKARIEELRQARRRAAITAIATQGAAALASGIAQAATLPWPANLAAAISTVAALIGLIAQAKAMLASDATSVSGPQTQQQGNLQQVPYGEKGLYRRPDGAVIMAAGGSTIPSKKQKNPGLITSGNGGGVLGGRLHRDGGNTLYDNATGQPLAEVERDELMLVMSRKATAANADLIPLLLRASREGKRITTFTNPLPMPNMASVRRAVSVPLMAEGGYMNNTVRFMRGTGLAPQGNSADGTTSRELLEAVGTLIAETRAGRQATQRIKFLKVGLLDLERRKTEYEQIKAINKGSRAA